MYNTFQNLRLCSFDNTLFHSKARSRNTIPPMGIGVKRRAIPSTARITETTVSRTAQISNRNTSRAAKRDNAKAKGVSNIFSSMSLLYFYSTISKAPHKLAKLLPSQGSVPMHRLPACRPLAIPMQLNGK